SLFHTTTSYTSCSLYRSIHHTFSSVFFSLLRPPPSSTLFPYTTLFRSPPNARGYFHRCLPALRRGRPCLAETRRGSKAWPPAPQDRKSTRLNSSHDQISYAVFCLKKKNKINIMDKYTYTNNP